MHREDGGVRTRLVPLLLLPLLAVPAAAAPPDLDAERLCRFGDARIGESSGLAVSTDGQALWTHNDSGDSSRFFAVDPRTCATRATYRLDLPDLTVPGLGTATAVDWEDAARGTAADGTPVLLLADIGDNPQARVPGVTVYEVAEPASAAAADPLTEQPVEVRAVHQLLYPSGPRDAESLLQLPDGRLVVVTKDRDAATGYQTYTGRSEVYASTGRPGTGPVRMTKVADLDVRALPGVDPAVQQQLAVTGADARRDGSAIVVRTLTTAYEFDVVGGDLAAAFSRTPRVVPLLATKQGEAIAYEPDGRGFLTTSEGSGSSADPGSGVVDAYRPHPAQSRVSG